MSKTVYDRYFPYALTVPAGTPIDTPTEVIIPVDNLILADVGLQIPDGPCGLTGIAFWFSGHQVLPWDEGSGWIQGNNLVDTFPVGLEVGPAPLSVLMYNLGVYQHTFYVRLHMKYLPDAPPAAAPAPLVIVPSSDAA